MRVSHEVTALFDDPNLISVSGLVPVMALAERPGHHRLISEHGTLGEFVLPSAGVRTSANPDGHLRRFLAATYEAAVATGSWADVASGPLRTCACVARVARTSLRAAQMAEGAQAPVLAGDIYDGDWPEDAKRLPARRMVGQLVAIQ